MKGGACGIGAGFGLGFFVFGFGARVADTDDLTGYNRRLLRQKALEINKERESGERPPRKDPYAEENTPDPLLDRMIRKVQARRARKTS